MTVTKLPLAPASTGLSTSLLFKFNYILIQGFLWATHEASQEAEIHICFLLLGICLLA